MRLLLLILLALFSSHALAEGWQASGSMSNGPLPPVAGLPNTLAPPPGDLSVSLLSSVFGVIDGVLHGTGSQILGAMFGVYNAAILTMSMIILVYIFIVGTLNTAHEGEIMGKKWSSIWLPLRTVAGVGLLLPKATGYSFIQIMVMWVVVQGVGAADLVWTKSLDYLLRGGVVVAPSSMYGGVASNGGVTSKINVSAFLIPIAGTIFKSEICMYSLQNILINTYPKKQIPFLANTLKVEQDLSNPQKLIMKFPGELDIGDGHSKQYPGMCGSVSWDKTNDAIVASQPLQSMQGTKIPAIATDSRSIAVQQVVLDLQPAAQRIANTLVPLTSTTPQPPLPLASLLTPNDLFYATADYIGIMTPYLNAQQSGTAATADALKEAKNVGWIMAGSYYFDMVKLKAAQNIEESNVVWASFPDLKCTEGATCKSAFLKDALQPISKELMSSNESAGCGGNISGNTVENYICNIEFKGHQTPQSANQLNPNVPGAGLSPPSPLFNPSARGDSDALNNIFLNIVSLGIAGAQASVQNVFSSMGSIYNAQTLGGNPIVMVGQLGVDIVSAVERIFISGIAIITVAVTVGSVIAFGFSPGIGMGLLAVLAWLLPLIGAILLPLLTAGAVMAWYVPLIPFILFIFGALTWFAAVIESMIAAPLVALGLAHPEGHEHLGQAQYAVMLLANIFLRPMLMIFGFIAATILASVMLWLVNYGFAKAWSNVGQDWLNIIYFVATIIVYMIIVLEIINKSFALIYEVPNKVLRWVGGTPESGGEAGLAEVKAGITSGLGTTTQVAGQIGGAVAGGAIEVGKKAISGAGGEVETKITPK